MGRSKKKPYMKIKASHMKIKAPHEHKFIILQTPALGNYVRSRHSEHGVLKNSWLVRGCAICGQIQRIMGSGDIYGSVDNFASISGRYWHGLGRHDKRP